VDGRRDDRVARLHGADGAAFVHLDAPPSVRHQMPPGQAAPTSRPVTEGAGQAVSGSHAAGRLPAVVSCADRQWLTLTALGGRAAAGEHMRAIDETRDCRP